MPIEFKEKSKGALSSKNFIRLKDGESVSCVLRGNPHEFKKHWIDKKTELCKGDACLYCKKGMKANFRFRINAVVSEGGAYVAKILEQGWPFYESLSILGDEYDLEKLIIKITRKGNALDTVYHVIPKGETKLTPEQYTAIEAVPLLKLDDFEETVSKGEADFLKSMNDSQRESIIEDIPF